MHNRFNQIQKLGFQREFFFEKEDSKRIVFGYENWF